MYSAYIFLTSFTHEISRFFFFTVFVVARDFVLGRIKCNFVLSIAIFMLLKSRG